MLTNMQYKAVTTSKGTTVFEPTIEPPIPGAKDIMKECQYYVLNFKNGYFYFNTPTEIKEAVFDKYGACGDTLTTGKEYVSSRLGNKIAFKSPSGEMMQVLSDYEDIRESSQMFPSAVLQEEKEQDSGIDETPDGYVMSTNLTYNFKGWIRYNGSGQFIPIDSTMLFTPYSLDSTAPCAEQNTAKPDTLHFERRVPFKCLQEAKTMTTYQDVQNFCENWPEEMHGNKRLGELCDDIEWMDDEQIKKEKSVSCGKHASKKKRKHVRLPLRSTRSTVIDLTCKENIPPQEETPRKKRCILSPKKLIEKVKKHKE